MERKFGWVRDPISVKDKLYSARPKRVSVPDLPRKTNNIFTAPPAVDQTNIGSCVGNSTAMNLKHDAIKQGVENAELPSRLFIYYNTRVMEGHRNEDTGCCIRNAIKIVAHLGAPPESLWPYVTERFAKCPPFSAYQEARKHQAVEYFRIDWSNLDEIKQCLAGGHGFVFGFTCFESFMSSATATSGVMQVPQAGEKEYGGHAVYGLDYDDDAMFPGWSKPGGVLVQNSWGEDWGIKGRFWMPYEAITSPTLSDDFWTIRKVEA